MVRQEENIRQMRRILTLGLLLALAPFLAQADFIVNGDFESSGPDTGTVFGYSLNSLQGGMWDVFHTMPGWSGVKDGIEVQTGGAATAEAHNHFIELDTHGSLTSGPDQFFDHDSSMAQAFTVAPGQAGLYRVVFDYKARTDRPFDHDYAGSLYPFSTWAIGVYLDGNLLMVQDDATQTTWGMEMTPEFGLTAGQHILAFSAVGLGWADSFGGLLDNIDILSGVIPPQIPEPATFLFVGSGLLGAYFLRRRRA